MTEPRRELIDEAHAPHRQRIEEKQEDIRTWLAGLLAGLFVALVIAVFVSAVVGGEQWERVQDFVLIAFGTVAGIVGSIVGFYFGSQRS